MRQFGHAQVIANVIAFLASPAAAYVNGISIPVDGGRTPTIKNKLSTRILAYHSKY